MNEISIQEYLFQRIREKLPASASLADVIAELLFISNDSAYRRIRGETLLVLEEAKTLCEAFSISLDELLKSKSNTIAFTATKLGASYSFSKYLKDIHNNLQFIASAEQKQIIYLTKDIPLFYNFLYKPLFAFRYFFWMKSILQHPDFASAKFSSGLLTPEIEEMGYEVASLYNSIPSTEIWNTECVNSTISQIEYYREAGFFESAEELANIYEALHSLIEHVRTQAEWGSKFFPGENAGIKQKNFECYYNRLILGDNTILVLLNGKKMLYLSYDVLNYIATQDEGFCEDAYERLQTHTRRATILSNTSEKQRNIFFNTLLKKIPQHSAVTKNNTPS